jgi:hypothetical protein
MKASTPWLIALGFIESGTLSQISVKTPNPRLSLFRIDSTEGFCAYDEAAKAKKMIIKDMFRFMCYYLFISGHMELLTS